MSASLARERADLVDFALLGATPVRLTASIERFPLSEPFAISRGAKTEAVVVVVRLETPDGRPAARGECVPYPRYDETAEATHAALVAAVPSDGWSDLRALDALCCTLGPASARNALDCALWDLTARLSGCSVWRLLRRPPPGPVASFVTLSLDTPEAMARAAQARVSTGVTHLKLKLGGDGDAARMAAVRAVAHDAIMIGDANEAWSPDTLAILLDAAASSGFALIEQPLPADADAALATVTRAVPVCADESVHGADDVARLADRYDAINIKLDKAGGITPALALADAARAHGLSIMVGSMVSTSLSMAAAMT
ncbi:MAG: dipeptide epimerase, partial [Pseudomonadota bacterium]